MSVYPQFIPKYIGIICEHTSETTNVKRLPADVQWGQKSHIPRKQEPQLSFNIPLIVSHMKEQISEAFEGDYRVDKAKIVIVQFCLQSNTAYIT